MFPITLSRHSEVRPDSSSKDFEKSGAGLVVSIQEPLPCEVSAEKEGSGRDRSGSYHRILAEPPYVAVVSSGMRIPKVESTDGPWEFSRSTLQDLLLKCSLLLL